MTHPCPCQSGRPYAECCAPFHTQQQRPETAEQLMRSRYAAYATQNTGYIIQTTVPAQQPLLDADAIARWSAQAQWLGLTVHRHLAKADARHAQVEFTACFAEDGQVRQHHELSAFVRIDGVWYFIDPTVPLPGMKIPCFCGADSKFKACCGRFFR